MSNLAKRLDELKKHIQTEEYLTGKGLSNEVNISIFCYDPKDEMEVRDFTEKLVNDVTLKCHVIENNLYKIFLQICNEKKVTEKIIIRQKTVGQEAILSPITDKFAEPKKFVEFIQYDNHQPGKDVVLITGVGEVFPFTRVHSLLDALQPALPDVPILVLYPGNYNGLELKLFNLLKTNPYYRAFNIIK